MNPILRKKINQIYAQGLSLRKIATRLRISHEAVRRAIPENKTRYRRIDKQMIKAIMESYERTGSYQKTADELGLPNRQAAYRIVVMRR